MKRLKVYLHCNEVGLLEQDDSGLLSFRYTPEWLSREDARQLSRTLPLTEEVFKGKKARPFFAGILPEEGPRRQIAAVLGISERNDFAMLERIGGECAGAVSLFPENTPPPSPNDAQVRRLDDDELAAVIDELPRRPLLAGEEGLRLSLAGAQNKLPVVVDAEGMALPLGNTPSSHIIKPEPDRFPGLVANEILCMRLAKAVGLEVPTVESRRVGDKACIVVGRYDRIADSDGRIVRVHQEDFCQALGFPPERKYQQEGGPLLRDCIRLLRDWSTAPVVDIRNFIDGLAFNVLIGNADAHGKNYSMLYPHQHRRLAPFYDLVCTVAWPELSKTLSMKIGKGKSLGEITPAHFRKMAEETRLGWPMMRERLALLCAKIDDAVSDHSFTRDLGDEPMREVVSEVVAARTTRMRRGLEG